MADSTTDHPVMMFIRGMPGSGKSYLAARLLETLGPERVVMLDPDAIDFESRAYKEFTKTPYAQEVEPKVQPFRYLKSLAFQGISAGKVIIWNQPFTNRGMFDRLVASLQDYAAEHSVPFSTLLIEVDIDAEVAKERVSQRKHEGGHGPSEATLNKRISDYESFADGYETVTVHGQDDVATSAKVVQEVLNRQQAQ